MKTTKVYRCECGEDVFESAGSCIGCGRPEDATKLREVEIADITKEEVQDTEPPDPIESRRKMSQNKILGLCHGDTIFEDAPRVKALAYDLAEECYELRRLCRDVLAYNPKPLPFGLEERLHAAAEGREVT